MCLRQQAQQSGVNILFGGITKSLFEQLGVTYHEENGDFIPDLKLPTEEEQRIGVWGQRHLDYLKQHRKVTYSNLLTSGGEKIFAAL